MGKRRTKADTKPATGTKKTAAQKRLEGNPGKRDIDLPPAPEATRLTSPPDMPPELEPLPHAAALWRKLAKQLTETRVLASTDLEALRVLCEVWHTYQSLQKFAEPKNMIQKTRSGYRQEHPGVRLRANAQKQLLTLWRQFGLTPLTREGVDADLPTDDDKGDYANERPS